MNYVPWERQLTAETEAGKAFLELVLAVIDREGANPFGDYEVERVLDLIEYR